MCVGGAILRTPVRYWRYGYGANTGRKIRYLSVVVMRVAFRRVVLRSIQLPLNLATQQPCSGP